MNTNQDSTNAAAGRRPGWNEPQPAKLPEPTAWPAAVALAVALILWGFISSFIISGVGVALFAASLAGWIGEIRHERSQE
jgi:hypothetical protein